MAAVAVVLVLVLRGGAKPNPRVTEGSQPSRLLGPAGFARAIARPGVVTINVHVPDQGSIPGTDLAIPYVRIEAMGRKLPPASTPLAVYCRSGRMSAIAARTLAGLGYASITELAGGMDAWRLSGRRVLPPA